jgi:hypothetical protein
VVFHAILEAGSAGIPAEVRGMNRRLLLALLAFAVILLPILGLAQNATAPTATQSSDTRMVVPANTTIPVSLRNTISSRTAYVGQAIYCETVYPIAVNDRIVIPVGSYVKGAVAQVVRAGRVKGTAKIGLRFESITLRNGVTRPLRATLSSYGGNGAEGFSRDEGKIEGESSKKEDVGKIATTGVQGALIGAIAGRGKGAGIGAGGGGAAGLIWILATRGKELVLPPGTSLELQLTAPLTLERVESALPERYQNGPALSPQDIGSDN